MYRNFTVEALESTCMWTWLPFALALPSLVASAQRGGPEFTPVDVPSHDGRYAARIEKVAGHERLADALARWELTVTDTARGEPLWSVPYPHQAEVARYFTAPDGTSFVRLGEPLHRWPAGRPHRPLREATRSSWSAATSPSSGTTSCARTRAAFWLTEEGDSAELGWHDTVHGPALVLALESTRGWRRELDVSMGLVPPPFEFGELAVVPGFPDGTLPADQLDVPYVTSVRVPSVALAGLPLAVHVAGRHSTPNWKFFAFQVAVETPADEAAAVRITLTPLQQAFRRPAWRCRRCSMASVVDALLAGPRTRALRARGPRPRRADPAGAVRAAARSDLRAPDRDRGHRGHPRHERGLPPGHRAPGAQPRPARTTARAP